MTTIEKLMYWKDHNVQITYNHMEDESQVMIHCPDDPSYDDKFSVGTSDEIDSDDREKIACNGWDGLRDVVHFYASWEVRQLEEQIGFCLPTKISENILCEIRNNGGIYNRAKKELFELWGWEDDE